MTKKQIAAVEHIKRVQIGNGWYKRLCPVPKKDNTWYLKLERKIAGREGEAELFIQATTEEVEQAHADFKESQRALPIGFSGNPTLVTGVAQKYGFR